MKPQSQAIALVFALATFLVSAPVYATVDTCRPNIIWEGGNALIFGLLTIPSYLAPETELGFGFGVATAQSDFDGLPLAAGGLAEGRWKSNTYQANFHTRSHFDGCEGAALATSGFRIQGAAAGTQDFAVRWSVGADIPFTAVIAGAGPSIGASLRGNMATWLRWDADLQGSAGFVFTEASVLFVSGSLANRLTFLTGVASPYIEARVGVEPFADPDQAEDDYTVYPIEFYAAASAGLTFVF